MGKFLVPWGQYRQSVMVIKKTGKKNSKNFKENLSKALSNVYNLELHRLWSGRGYGICRQRRGEIF